MNPIATEVLDRKLKKCLAECANSKLTSSQRNFASEQLKKLALEAEAVRSSNLVEEVGRFFLTRKRLNELRQPVIFPTEQLLELGRRGLAATLQFGILDSPESFAVLPVEVLLREVPLVSLNLIAQRRQKLLSESLDFLQKQPESAICLAGLDWVIAKSKIELLFPLFPVIFGGEDRSVDFNRLSALRDQILRRDKSGNGILEILRGISKGELSKAALTDGLSRCPDAAVVFLRILPKLLSKETAGHELEILENWLPSLPEISLPNRAKISGALAILCGGIIQKVKLTFAEENILAIVTASLRQLSLEIGGDFTGYWGIFPLGESRLQGADSAQISAEHARLLVESLEKLEDKQYDPISVFTALAINFGLSKFEETGTEVGFDPKRHNDTVGGLLRGQAAVVIRPGWRYKETILLRAKTKPLVNNA